MPLVSERPGTNSAVSPSNFVKPKVIPSVNEEMYRDKNIYYDNKWISRKDIIIYAEGASWSVDYYSQVLASDTQLSGQQVSRDPVYQSYKKIKDLILKVTSALADSQDEKTKAFTITGTAILTAGIIPNEGDMLVADIGENKQACFKVTTTTKKSHFKTSVYEINYILITDDSATRADLENRTVSTLQYVQNMYGSDTAELLLESEVQLRSQAEGIYHDLLNDYLEMFLNEEHKTLILPMQEYSCYEYYMNEYFRKFFDSADCETIYEHRLYSVDEKTEYMITSILDVILARNSSAMRHMFTKVTKVPVRYFTTLSMSQSLRYSGMYHCIYPKDTKRFNTKFGEDFIGNTIATNIELPEYYNATYPHVDADTGLTIDLRWARPTHLSSIITDEYLTIQPACLNGNYIFSQSFYNRTTVNLFELTVLDYIDGKKIHPETIIELSKGWYNWPIFEKFYYGIIILTLLKALKQSAL